MSVAFDVAAMRQHWVSPHLSTTWWFAVGLKLMISCKLE
jgi:hypothetical protein